MSINSRIHSNSHGKSLSEGKNAIRFWEIRKDKPLPKEVEKVYKYRLRLLTIDYEKWKGKKGRDNGFRIVKDFTWRRRDYRQSKISLPWQIF